MFQIFQELKLLNEKHYLDKIILNDLYDAIGKKCLQRKQVHFCFFNLYEAASTSGWEVAGGKFSDKSAASVRNVYTCIRDGRGGFSCFFQVSVVYTARKFQRRIEAFSGVTEQRQDLAVKILENYRSVETAISWWHTFSVQPAAKTSTNGPETRILRGSFRRTGRVQ